MGDNPAQFGETPETRFGKNLNQVRGNTRTSFGESGKLDCGIHQNINMYTESTTEKKAETNPENREGEEREEEAELEEEKEKRLLLLIIEGCCRVIPEEDPAEVTELIIKAVEIFTAEWVREAINEAALCNKRNLLGILEILDSWMKQGHNKTSRRSMADYASNLGTASH